ncbi:AI-2E family transporter [Solwaraspora sp. WMMD1047]|uniref:AI-2E family transporter n=1 Tax=Solwaraspora sp. WMMD1047 TaxID=3016102 RepID=UPI002416F878|nr:AI-2E family transporter [Solwaraspora sp. WMMD1047]MDG4833748.1 AI-2E family transporter [Solwaraspora sp. WMMD1047]
MPDPQPVSPDLAAPASAGVPFAAADADVGGGERVRRIWDRLPWLLRWSVVYSGCLLIVAAGLYVLGLVAARLAPLTIAVAATLFIAALLDPVTVRLRRHGWPASLAALAAVLLFLVVVVGSVALAWWLTADQFTNLVSQLDEGTARLRDFLTSGTAPISADRLDALIEQAGSGLRRSAPDPVAGARTAAETVGAILLGLVLLFFLLKDGRSMWRWVLRRTSDRSRPVFVAAGRAGWQTLAAYTRGTVAIAAIDAAGIGLALVLLRVPLALPLTLITFLGAFVPIIGATVAGSVAVLVALAANGPTTALLTAAAVITVQQLEGNLLEPLIMKHQVRLHPVVVLVAVTAGTLTAGIPGAFVAVPLTAIVYQVVRTVADCRRATGLPEPP